MSASPGPWRKCGDDRGGCKCGIVWSIPEDRAVAYVQLKDESGECSEATFHANATLIASAPTMAEMLRELEWHSWGDDGPEFTTCPICEVLKPGPHNPDCRLNALLRSLP